MFLWNQAFSFLRKKSTYVTLLVLVICSKEHMLSDMKNMTCIDTCSMNVVTNHNDSNSFFIELLNSSHTSH